MKAYTATELVQKRTDFINLVIPILANGGYEPQYAQNLFDSNQVSLRWGKDWNNFTVYTTNPFNAPTGAVDELVRSIFRGEVVSNRLVMTCFLASKGQGLVSSLAITDLHTLASGLKMYGTPTHQGNQITGQAFLTLPFGHPSLSKNVWGLGIKR